MRLERDWPWATRMNRLQQKQAKIQQKPKIYDKGY
jgi:hypothetical protein